MNMIDTTPRKRPLFFIISALIIIIFSFSSHATEQYFAIYSKGSVEREPGRYLHVDDKTNDLSFSRFYLSKNQLFSITDQDGNPMDCIKHGDKIIIKSVVKNKDDSFAPQETADLLMSNKNGWKAQHFTLINHTSVSMINGSDGSSYFNFDDLTSSDRCSQNEDIISLYSHNAQAYVSRHGRRVIMGSTDISDSEKFSLIFQERRAALAMIIGFSDLPPEWTISELSPLLYDNIDSVSKLIKKSSFNQIFLKKNDRYIINVPLDESVGSECKSHDWSDSVDSWVEANYTNINVSDYDHKIYIFPYDIPCPGWSGSSALHGDQVWIRVRKGDNDWMRGVLARELGHNLGLGQAMRVNDDGSIVAYGDSTGFMGVSSKPHQMIASFRYLLQFFRSRQIETLELLPGNRVSTTLTAIDNPTKDIIQIVKIPVRDDEAYFISHRTQDDIFDMHSESIDKVHVHYLLGVNSILVKVLSDGESMHITKTPTDVILSSAYSITIDGIERNEADVTVNVHE